MISIEFTSNIFGVVIAYWLAVSCGPALSSPAQRPVG